MNRILNTLAFCLLAMPLAVLAQGRPYTEGPVTQVVAIKIKAGNFDKYMAYLASTWKKEQEALKAAGIITEYGIYSATARGPHDADVYLTSTYENMAALDGLDDRSDPVLAKALGTSREQDMKGMAERNDYREVLGVETIRELKFK
jgi:hypothetical protein